MAQIVCIKEARIGYCDVGDVVSIHDDNVELSGNGYKHSNIISVSGTASYVQNTLNDLVPKIRYDEDTDIEEWLDGDTWKTITKRPKYTTSLKNLTDVDIELLKTDNTLLTKAVDNISLDVINTTIIINKEK